MRDLKGSRRELALVFADGRWRTANEAARAMGRPTGSIFGVLRRMHQDGLLEPDTDEEVPRRGTQYRLTAQGQAALVAALAEEQPPGRVAVGTWLVIVEHGEAHKPVTSFNSVLENPSVAGEVAWGVSLAWGWILALVEGAAEWHATRLARAFEEHGFRCRYASPTTLTTGAQLRTQAATLLESVGATP